MAVNMNDDGYFDDRIAATYDDDTDIFDPKVVGPTVDVGVTIGDFCLLQPLNKKY